VSRGSPAPAVSPLPGVEPAEFDFELPADRIAQRPLARREDARMLCLDRRSGAIEHAGIADWPRRLEPGDLVVVNTTRVVPARLRGHKTSGGRAEALLLGPAGAAGEYRALLRCRGRLRPGLALRFARAGRGLDAEVVAVAQSGEATLRFGTGADPYALGEAPLPPYIERAGPDPDDDARYQTVYASEPGAVAAPTAGLHLSEPLLEALAARGVERAPVVLHVGVGTFRPLDERTLASGELHAEAYHLPPETAEAVDRARARGRRVVAVGTTTTRVLESRARADGGVDPGRGETRLFLRPGSRFRVVDALLTNFHLPRSSLLMLVAAFAGRERVLAAYRSAVARGYRFYSYGDCMWIA